MATFKILKKTEEPSSLMFSNFLFPNTIIEAKCIEDGRIVRVYMTCGKENDKVAVKQELTDTYDREIKWEQRDQSVISEGDIL